MKKIMLAVCVLLVLAGCGDTKQWRPISLSDIQFKVGKTKETTYNGKTKTTTIKVSDDYDVYAQITKGYLLKKDCALFVRLIKDTYDISAYLTLNYNDKTGVIYGLIHTYDTRGFVYLGKGKIEGDILKPVFIKNVSFNFNPKAKVTGCYMPGIEMILPYTFDELKGISEGERKEQAK